MLESQIGALLMTAVISSPPDSTAHGIGSTTSPRTRASTVALTECSRMAGLATYARVTACSLILSRITEEHRNARAASVSFGMSTASDSRDSFQTKKGPSEMAQDKYDKLGPLLGAVGEEVAADLNGNPDGAYLYVEVGDRWISVNLYREESGAVRNLEHGSELTDAIWKVWEAENSDPKKRWSVMEYQIDGTKFAVEFKYADEVDVETYDADRRRAALKKRFRDKPVIYPPIPDHLLNGAAQD
jgi:hypothetical protein